MAIQSLKNKKIVISAGASGIGLATTKICLERGATVFVSDINEKFIKKLRKNFKNKKIFIYHCDASNENDVNDLFDKIKKKTPKIDALINNVGIAGPTGTIEKLSSFDWENTLKVNVISHFYFTKNAIPLLKKNKGGTIINLSSGAGIMGFPLRSPYAASKWAIVGVTKTLAMELGKFKIRVNAICPGSVEGDRMKRVVDAKASLTKTSPKKVKQEFESMVSLQTFVNKEDIASMALFLLGDESQNISGQAMIVDGNTERMN